MYIASSGELAALSNIFLFLPKVNVFGLNKGNNKITELRTMLQRESQNS